MALPLSFERSCSPAPVDASKVGHLTGEPKPFQHGKLHSEKKQNPKSLPTAHTDSSDHQCPHPYISDQRHQLASNFRAPTFAEKKRRKKRERKNGAAKTEFQRPWLLTANVQYTSSHYLHCQASLPRYRAAGAGVATDQTNSTSGGWVGGRNRGEKGESARQYELADSSLQQQQTLNAASRNRHFCFSQTDTHRT